MRPVLWAERTENDGGDSAPATLPRAFGKRGQADVQRAIAEFLAGRPVILTDAACPPRLVLPVDALSLLDELRGLAAGPLALIVSGRRAEMLGAQGLRAATLRLPASATQARGMELACAGSVADAGPLERGDRVAEAAVELAKLSQLLPAVVAGPLADGATIEGLLRVDAVDALSYRAGHAGSLRRVSTAPVPLRAASDCELTVFRDEFGQSWSMIRVGRPDTRAAVPVRLHSACLTGDAFASLRCDCGDQLQMALSTIQSLGGGVLLYLAQEGCGIGLANKMRAYRLQEEGLDTVDANTALGFEVDERRYEIAARMLQMSGIERVALLTNNPSKLAALQAAGIDVRERVPLLAPMRSGNRRYLETKRSRAGHLLGGVSAAAAS